MNGSLGLVSQCIEDSQMNAKVPEFIAWWDAESHLIFVQAGERFLGFHELEDEKERKSCLSMRPILCLA